MSQEVELAVGDFVIMDSYITKVTELRKNELYHKGIALMGDSLSDSWDIRNPFRQYFGEVLDGDYPFFKCINRQSLYNKPHSPEIKQFLTEMVQFIIKKQKCLQNKN